MMDRLFELDRLDREGKNVGETIRSIERRLWESVEARIDMITAKDMKPKKENKVSE